MAAYNKKTIEDIEVAGKTVLVRCDFNVPMKDGVITSDKRIVGALPTIEYLLNAGAKVILCSRLYQVLKGPPERTRDELGTPPPRVPSRQPKRVEASVRVKRHRLLSSGSRWTLSRMIRTASPSRRRSRC